MAFQPGLPAQESRQLLLQERNEETAWVHCPCCHRHMQARQLGLKSPPPTSPTTGGGTTRVPGCAACCPAAVLQLLPRLLACCTTSVAP